jgi:hypothetical protein
MVDSCDQAALLKEPAIDPRPWYSLMEAEVASRPPQESYDIFMTQWAEQRSMLGPIGQKALGLLASCNEYPNRPLKTLVLGAPELYADDAAVRAQLHKLMHSIVGNK